MQYQHLKGGLDERYIRTALSSEKLKILVHTFPFSVDSSSPTILIFSVHVSFQEKGEGRTHTKYAQSITLYFYEQCTALAVHLTNDTCNCTRHSFSKTAVKQLRTGQVCEASVQTCLNGALLNKITSIFLEQTPLLSATFFTKDLFQNSMNYLQGIVICCIQHVINFVQYTALEPSKREENKIENIPQVIALLQLAQAKHTSSPTFKLQKQISPTSSVGTGSNKDGDNKQGPDAYSPFHQRVPC